MAMVVRTKPFDYEASFVKKESPEMYSVSGTVYEQNEDDAIAAVERMYESAHRGVLRTVRIKARWDEEQTGATTKYLPPPTPAAPVVPKFRFDLHVEGIKLFIDYWELDVVPFTCKENENE